MDDASQIVPVLRYKDAELAAGWLCRAFGFRRRRVVREAAGDVSYILLACGRSTLLIRPVSSGDFDDLMVQPENAGQASTQVCYLVVPDVDAHYRRAAIAGARIELAPGSDGFGGAFYSCRDLEGHVWSFGTRDYQVAPRAIARLGAGLRRASQWVSVAAAMAVAAGAWAFRPEQVPPMVTASIPALVRSDVGAEVANLRQGSAAALDRARAENARLAAEVAAAQSRERRQRVISEQAGADLARLRDSLASERTARGAATAEAARSTQEVKALHADVEQQKQHRAALQEQLQATMAALVDARREAEPARGQPPSMRADAVASQRPSRARPAEAIACYRQVMRGSVSWGGGTAWLSHNAHVLCAGTRDARRTIGCFEAGIRGGRPWREALNACRAT